jgi:hypothetical protein
MGEISFWDSAVIFSPDWQEDNLSIPDKRAQPSIFPLMVCLSIMVRHDRKGNVFLFTLKNGLSLFHSRGYGFKKIA